MANKDTKQDQTQDNTDIPALLNSLSNDSLDPDTRALVRSLGGNFGMEFEPTMGMGNLEKAGYYAKHALQTANDTVESIPVLGDLAKKAGQLGSAAVAGADALQEKAEAYQAQNPDSALGSLAPMAATALSGAARLLPQNALGAGLMALPIAAKGIGAAAGGISDTASEAVSNMKEALNASDRSGLARIINPLPGQAMEESATNLGDKAQALDKALGGSLTAEPADSGFAAQQEAIKQSQKAKALAGQPWEDLKAMANRPDIPQTYPENLANAARELNVSATDLPKELQSGRFYKVLSGLDQRLNNPQSMTAEAGEGVNTPGTDAANEGAQATMQELLASRQELAAQAAKGNGAIKLGQPGAAGFANKASFVYGKLRDAVDQDISEAAGQVKDPEFQDAFTQKLQDARDAWSTFKGAYGNKTVQQFLKTQPADIGDFLSKSPKNLQALRDIIGPTADKAAQESISQDLLDKISNTSDPLGALEKYKANNGDMIEQLLRPSHMDAFQDYAGARAKMLATNPPQPVTLTEALRGAVEKLFPKATAAAHQLGALRDLSQQ